MEKVSYHQCCFAKSWLPKFAGLSRKVASLKLSTGIQMHD